ncbi:bifunctional 4-hydroxy-2-oxoglutarate aldolase/2-dehydro-3-deoxy-phosphogluconate aldolase [Bacillus sp. J33]|uniref:bifunctional 4-hydroxy-2-oxoglutarate aldolase/2-dehydro-3-deoxy-phosphogluconate aldolase n=1 Tax=Bacillus sp. J33 TaxID=935836 RepID=UPI00047D986F|nr:bifunctional 4-hydroxy-2-oxoglutarate aldolase/2-dehydro-3-deoxy-phosphogluconate aldolase [Bacillus sp. J33]
MSDSMLSKLLSSGIIAVVRKVNPDRAVQLVDSFIKGGVSGIELTVDSESAYEKIGELKSLFSEAAVIGAGTVVNVQQAKAAIDAGADFIVSPILDRDIIEYVKQEGKIMMPGVFTPTEMKNAYTWGADVVKVFPASALGPGFFKDVNGPLGYIPKMPTGGINLNNVQDFIKAGAVAAGIGGSLVNTELIQQENWEALEKLARKYTEKAALAGIGK